MTGKYTAEQTLMCVNCELIINDGDDFYISEDGHQDILCVHCRK